MSICYQNLCAKDFLFLIMSVYWNYIQVLKATQTASLQSAYLFSINSWQINVDGFF